MSYVNEELTEKCETIRKAIYELELEIQLVITDSRSIAFSTEERKAYLQFEERLAAMIDTRKLLGQARSRMWVAQNGKTKA